MTHAALVSMQTLVSVYFKVHLNLHAILFSLNKSNLNIILTLHFQIQHWTQAGLKRVIRPSSN